MLQDDFYFYIFTSVTPMRSTSELIEGTEVEIHLDIKIMYCLTTTTAISSHLYSCGWINRVSKSLSISVKPHSPNYIQDSGNQDHISVLLQGHCQISSGPASISYSYVTNRKKAS